MAKGRSSSKKKKLSKQEQEAAEFASRMERFHAPLLEFSAENHTKRVWYVCSGSWGYVKMTAEEKDLWDNKRYDIWDPRIHPWELAKKEEAAYQLWKRTRTIQPQFEDQEWIKVKDQYVEYVEKGQEPPPSPQAAAKPPTVPPTDNPPPEEHNATEVLTAKPPAKPANNPPPEGHNATAVTAKPPAKPANNPPPEGHNATAVTAKPPAKPANNPPPEGHNAAVVISRQQKLLDEAQKKKRPPPKGRREVKPQKKQCKAIVEFFNEQGFDLRQVNPITNRTYEEDASLSLELLDDMLHQKPIAWIKDYQKELKIQPDTTIAAYRECIFLLAICAPVAPKGFEDGFHCYQTYRALCTFLEEQHQKFPNSPLRFGDRFAFVKAFMSYAFSEEVVSASDGFDKTAIKTKSIKENRRSMLRKDRLALPLWSIERITQQGKKRVLKDKKKYQKALKGRPLHYALLMDRIIPKYGTMHLAACHPSEWECTKAQKQEAFHVNDGKRLFVLVPDSDDEVGIL